MFNPDHAMILAAGHGKRMRPITDKIPKPLVKVFNKPLIDYSFEALARAGGVKKVIVNVHYLADQIEAHIVALEKNDRSPEIIISDERDSLLDSGGGIAKALPFLGSKPFFLMNADTFWLEGLSPNLTKLAEAFDPKKMDMILMLADIASAVGYHNKGDFTMDSEGHLKRRKEGNIAPFAYAGAAIINPEIFINMPNGIPQGAFSINKCFDEAIEKNRLYGMRMDGLWLHVGTPQAIGEAENAIARSAA